MCYKLEFSNWRESKMSENQEEAASVVEETSAEEAPLEEATAEKAPVDEAPEAAKKPKATKASSAKEGASAKKGSAMATDDIMSAIKNMTVLELAELVKALESEFGVSAAVPAVAAVAAPAEASTAAATEEQTEFTVVLQSIGENKINVIKAVRELTSLGLKESKDLVESAPQPVKENITKEEAAAAREKLEAAGATVQVT